MQRSPQCWSSATRTDAPTRFLQLSPSLQKLVRLCQDINFGAIHRLRVENGQPTLDPPPEVSVDLKLDRDLATRPEVTLTDFELCAELRRLLRHIQDLGTGVFERIEVQAGIPRRVLVQGRLDLCSRSLAAAQDSGPEC